MHWESGITIRQFNKVCVELTERCHEDNYINIGILFVTQNYFLFFITLMLNIVNMMFTSTGQDVC